MSVLNYVDTYDDIRGLLGVSAEELEDAAINLKVYQYSLEEALREIGVDLISDYETVCAIALAVRTSVQRRLVEAVRSYSTYHIAAALTAALPMFAPKTISDGKALMQRQAGALYDVVRLEILKGKALSQTRLIEAFAEANGSTAAETPPFLGMVISSPTSDPVLGT